jgi:hypothetical protein
MLKGLGINLTGSRIKYLIGELRKSSRRHHKASDSDSSTSVQEATENQSGVIASDKALETNTAKGKSKTQQQAVEAAIK